MMKRREYDIEITVNGQTVHKVIIDPHYEEKHGASVDDQIVLELVKQLDGELFEPEAIQPRTRILLQTIWNLMESGIS